MAARKSVKNTINSEQLRNRLKLRSITSEEKLYKNHPEAKSFYEKLGLRPGRIREGAAKALASGALAGTLLLGVQGRNVPSNTQTKHEPFKIDYAQNSLADFLRKLLPPEGKWDLTAEIEKQISQKLMEKFGIKASASLEGNKLNNSYGRMGAEQNLPRYPGDNLYDQRELPEKGITPGLGAWGFFAYSKSDMTPELYATEKWYVAVQTLYLPNWNTDTKRLSQWYKYRHVVVVNPANGKAVIAAIADAGPSAFTGKHFGGSPSVMKYLGINYGMQNHPVVLFFVDDPNNEIPLGPLEYNVAQMKQNLETKS